MPTLGFSHYNLRADRALLDTLKDFYCEIVGLAPGARPPFETFGYWLYAGAQDVLHLSEAAAHETRTVGVKTTFDHVALACTDRVAAETRLRAHRIPFDTGRVPHTGHEQLFFADPAGNGVELIFAPTGQAAARHLAPPFTPAADLDAGMCAAGYAVLDAAGVEEALGVNIRDLAALAPAWNDLPPDRHLRDGGHYRRRRHASLIVDGARVEQAPHRAHWQPVEYNALHGGFERWFEPITDALTQAPVWPQLIGALARHCSAVQGEPGAASAGGARRWYVEAHQFRIDTTDGIGRPTPEGAHRDGVDFVAVFLVGRSGVKGGESRVFDADGPRGLRFTLEAPWTLLLLDDARVIHETTPIQPAEAATVGHRDTLVLTFRRNGFLEPGR